MERESQKFQIPQMPLPEEGSPQSTPTIPERVAGRNEWFYANGPVIFKTDEGHFSEPIDPTQEEDHELLSFDFDTAEGIDEAKQYAEANFTQALEMRDNYQGKWPQRILRELFESIELQNKEILKDLDQQKNYILGKSLEGKGANLAAKLVQLNRSIDALYEMENEDALAKEPQTAKASKTSEPEVEIKQPETVAEVAEAEVMNEQSFRHLSGRIRAFRRKIASTLQALESRANLEEHHRALLNDLASYDEALDGIVGRGGTEAKAQEGTNKVFSASLKQYAESYFEKINTTVNRLVELYPPNETGDGIALEAQVDENAIRSELSRDDEQELLEDYFLKYIAGPDSEEKRESVQKQLYMLSPNERAAALQDALAELYEDSDAPTELVPAPQSAVDAMERLSQLPGQEAEEKKTGWFNPQFRAEQGIEEREPAEQLTQRHSTETSPSPFPPEPLPPTDDGTPRTGWFNEAFRREKLGTEAEPEVVAGGAADAGTEGENKARRSGWWNPETAKERARTYAGATTAVAAAEKIVNPEEQAARAKWLAARKKVLFTELSKDEQEKIVLEHVMNTPPKTGEPSVKEKLAAATTEEEKAKIMAEVTRQMSGWSKEQQQTALNESLAARSEDLPLQNKYQNELTGHYDKLKQEGNGFERFWQRARATFGFKPELPPELAGTRKEMFDATADYTKETREMVRLRQESGKDSYDKLSPERKQRLLEGALLRGVGWHDKDGIFHSRLHALQKATTDAQRAEILADRDKMISELDPEAKQRWIEGELKRVQSRYEKMLGRSVLMGTFERQMEAQRQVTEDLSFKAPEILKKHKRKITLFAAGAIGGWMGGGAISAGIAVARSFAGGIAGAAIGGAIGEKWKNRIERKTSDETEAVLNSLAERLSKDSITTKELEDTYQELKKIYEQADNKTRVRIASLMAIALAVGVATGQALEFGAETTGIIDAPDGGSGAVGTREADGLEAGGSETLGDPDASSDGTAAAEVSQAASGNAEGGTENLKPYDAKAGDNMWDILEGQTKAGELPFMDQVDPDKLQGLLKEVELKLDASEALRTEIGFGESSHDLGLGDEVNLEKLNELALKIATEKGMVLDANVAEAAAAAEATPEAISAESVETAADTSPEQPAPQTEAAEADADKAATESTAEASAAERKPAIFQYEADRVVPDNAEPIPGKTIDTPHIGNDPSKVGGPVFDGQPYYEGASYEGLKGADQVKAYAANYDGGPFDRGPLAFENQLVKPYVGSVEGTVDKGFLGLFKQPPPPSMGGYAYLQNVPLQKIGELNALPDAQLLPTLVEDYHVENPEQFSVWVEKLNDMQNRGVFNLDQTPDITLADAVGLDVINNKSTNV